MRDSKEVYCIHSQPVLKWLVKSVVNLIFIFNKTIYNQLVIFYKRFTSQFKIVFTSTSPHFLISPR